MQTTVKIGPSNASPGQYRRKNRMKLFFIRVEMKIVQTNLRKELKEGIRRKNGNLFKSKNIADTLKGLKH